jgi:hypothetical protein
MSEKLPPGTLDQLADSIWLLGKLGIERHIALMPPATITGVIWVEDVCLEPYFTLDKPMPAALAERPMHLGLSISETEKLLADEDYTMYAYKKIDLFMDRRRLRYHEGTIVQHEDGSIIEPATDKRVRGSRASRYFASRAWLDTVELGRAKYKPETMTYFLETIDRALLSAAASGDA